MVSDAITRTPRRKPDRSEPDRTKPNVTRGILSGYRPIPARSLGVNP
jgi:hypothetical protein